MSNSVDNTISNAQLDSHAPLSSGLGWLKRRAPLAHAKARSNAPPAKKKLLFEAMEQRVLLAGDPVSAFVVAHVHGSLDAPGETDRFTFTLAADMQVVFEVADRISVLHQGRIIADGPPDEIRASKDVQRVYLGETI